MGLRSGWPGLDSFRAPIFSMGVIHWWGYAGLYNAAIR
jgi:hypothetical protein